VAATETLEVRAIAKWVRMSPRKARLVTEHIRGRSVPEARTVLAFTQRAAAREIEKVLASAVANAEANHGLAGDTLVVSSAYVDQGPTMKRWRPRARGRVNRIRKPTCHITIKLRPVEEFVPAAAPPPPAAQPPVRERGPGEGARGNRGVPAETAATEEEQPQQEEQPKPRARKPAAEKKPAPKRTAKKKTEEAES
jgi:large subunit ribosomal protein L22